MSNIAEAYGPFTNEEQVLEKIMSLTGNFTNCDERKVTIT